MSVHGERGIHARLAGRRATTGRSSSTRQCWHQAGSTAVRVSQRDESVRRGRGAQVDAACGARSRPQGGTGHPWSGGGARDAREARVLASS